MVKSLSLSAMAMSLSISIAPAHPILEMRGNQWIYNGQTLRFLDRSETWLKALGNPSRVDSSKVSMTYVWDSLGILASGWNMPSGKVYISHMRLKFTDKNYGDFEGKPRRGFPGKVILQGVVMETRPPQFREVQAKMKPTFSFQERGWPKRHSAGFEAREPDGFDVGANVVFHCPADSASTPSTHRLPAFRDDSLMKDECRYFFNELESGVTE